MDTSKFRDASLRKARGEKNNGKNVLTNKKENPKKEDRLRVTLALSKDDASISGPCPDPNEMAAFVDGTINRKNSKEIAAHLNSCHDCYNDWLIVSSAMVESKKSSIINDLKNTINELKLIVTGVVDRFMIPKPIFNYGLAAAVAACLVITFWTVKSSNLGDLINNSYTPTIVAGISQDDLEFNNIYKLPWEKSKTSYGFAPQPTDSDTFRAFGAGLWSARQEVIDDKRSFAKPDFVKETQAWQKSPQEIDYWMGRWSYLLRAVCLSDEEISPEFWGKQLEILKKTHTKYSKSHNKDNEFLKMVTVRLGNIKSILSKSDEGILNRESRRDIAVELDFLINSLSPRYSEKG